MSFHRVQPDDDAALAATIEILEAARRLDDPGSPAPVLELQRRWLRYGWDLRPDEWYLYAPEPGAAPVGLLSIDLPSRDNLHLVWADITVHPDHRRHGHGSAIMAEVIRRADEAGRTTVWVGGPSDDPAPTAFATHHGFRFASPEARRKQHLAEVAPDAVGVLRREAEAAASEYELQRLLPPLTDELMTEVAEVAESINDAPMGDLTYEPEVFDLDLMRDVETAARGRGEHVYRVVARHRSTGRLGGHTVVAVNPLRPSRGVQCDTAVSREHRGRRLGLLLKIEMMAWLAETEPQLEYIETSNQAGNDYMISVNEALGYRLDRIFHVFERQLTPARTGTEPAVALATA
ncbi:GNAT family N-acetyltransferase [uncultured Friedmanniella sp.]|uniref:GNAT family N-acetyltransferase n=1 Tax=uncultured Friedmanniella sp. TaxID=335381 RepID=UPI0035CAEE8F